MAKSENIKITRYEHPKVLGFDGAIKAEGGKWVVFFGPGGTSLYPLDADGGVGHLAGSVGAEPST